MIGIDTLLGGVTGLLGTIATGILKYQNQKIKYENDQKMVALNTAAFKEKAQMKIQVTAEKVKGEIQKADTEAYKQSIVSAGKPLFSEKWIDKLFSVQGKFGRFFAIPCAVFIAMGFAFVDWLRGFMRPVLTLYLTGMSTVITYMAWNIMKANNIAAMTPTQAVDIYTRTTSIIIYLTVSCVTWWFGDRTMSKALTDIHGKEGKEG
jgi:predicted RND superfamily exporter protein